MEVKVRDTESVSRTPALCRFIQYIVGKSSFPACVSLALCHRSRGSSRAPWAGVGGDPREGHHAGAMGPEQLLPSELVMVVGLQGSSVPALL